MSIMIKVKYFGDADEIQMFSLGDWIDLRSAEDIWLREGEYHLIPLGVAMELPQGFEAWIAPRSSTYKNWGIMMANGIGIIDNSYRGDGDQWHFPAVAHRETHIRKGDRICQFRIMMNQPDLRFEVVPHLGNADRGGIGSSGTR